MSWIWALFQSPYKTYSDYALWQAMLFGEVFAFEEIYDRYADKIYMYSYHITWNKKEAEDVVSMSMLKLYEYLQKNSWTNLKGLIYRIAHNEIINQFKWNRYVVWEDNHMVNVQDNDSMIDEVEHIYVRSYLEQGLDLLDPKAKEILYLLYYEELSYHEIADIMSSSTNTVWVRVMRAKKQLKTKLWVESFTF